MKKRKQSVSGVCGRKLNRSSQMHYYIYDKKQSAEEPKNIFNKILKKLQKLIHIIINNTFVHPAIKKDKRMQTIGQ